MSMVTRMPMKSLTLDGNYLNNFYWVWSKLAEKSRREQLSDLFKSKGSVRYGISYCRVCKLSSPNNVVQGIVNKVKCYMLPRIRRSCALFN